MCEHVAFLLLSLRRVRFRCHSANYNPNSAVLLFFLLLHPYAQHCIPSLPISCSNRKKKIYNFCRTYFVSHKRVETWKKAPEFARFLQTDVKMFQGVPFFSVWKANMSMPMDLILYSNVVICFLQTYIKGPHPVIKDATNYTIIIHLISFYTYFSYNI